MKILFFNIYTLSPHFETELELIRKHQNKNDDIYIVKCGMTLDSCMWNPNHYLHNCVRCQSRAFQGYDLFNINKENLYDLEIFDKAYELEVPFFDSVEDVLQYQYEGIRIGEGVVSSLITQTRNYTLSSHTHKNEIDKNVKMAVNVYFNFKKKLEEIKPDLVYIFNGRFAEQKPLFDLCKKKNIQFYTHERGGKKNQYALFSNDKLHNPYYVNKEVHSLWESAGPDREKIATEWFLNRRKRVEQNWLVFTADQDRLKLPENFDSKRKNVAIFNSSEDEYFGIEERKNSLFKFQHEALKKIFERFKGDTNIHFYIRVHPNLKGIENFQTEELYKLNFSNLTIIPPESKVDSYALLDATDLTVCFGSTIGIEAAFSGKPSILLGTSFYMSLNSIYHPQNWNEVFDLLQKDLTPKNSKDYLKYAYWEEKHGEEFQYFKVKDFFTLTYNGEVIDYQKEFKIIQKLKNIHNEKLYGEGFQVLKNKINLDSHLKGLYKIFYLKVYRYLESKFSKE